MTCFGGSSKFEDAGTLTVCLGTGFRRVGQAIGRLGTPFGRGKSGVCREQGDDGEHHGFDDGEVRSWLRPPSSASGSSPPPSANASCAGRSPRLGH